MVSHMVLLYVHIHHETNIYFELMKQHERVLVTVQIRHLPDHYNECYKLCTYHLDHYHNGFN